VQKNHILVDYLGGMAVGLEISFYKRLQQRFCPKTKLLNLLLISQGSYKNQKICLIFGNNLKNII
jgi:hypothetical protein